MRATFLTLLVASLLPTISTAQNNPTLSGFIKDASSGEALIGASLVVTEINKGASTNTYGYYSLTIPAGTYSVVVRYLGFEELTKTVELKADMKLNWDLQPKVYETQAAKVTGKKGKGNTESTDMGRMGIDV